MERFSPSRPEIASWPFTTGSTPLRKSKLPASDVSTYAPKGAGGAGSAMLSSFKRLLTLPATILGVLTLFLTLCAVMRSSSGLNECQQVLVDLILVRCAQAV